MAKIDRDTPIPAYYQIRMDLAERIKHGEWSDTNRLPSEGALADFYAVSRITLRQALAELEKDGIIKKSRGRSATICEHPQPFVHKLNYSLVSANHSQNGDHEITASVITLQRYDIPYPDVAEALQMVPGIPVAYLKRFFYLDRKPLAIGRSWLSLGRFPEIDKIGLIDGHLTDTLKRRYGVSAVRVDDSIEAVRPTPSDLEFLDVSYDTPMLSVRGISYDQYNQPVEYSTTLWLGDRVRFKIAIPLNGPVP